VYSRLGAVGVATGLVVVGDLIGEGAAQEEAVIDDMPNLAARVQALVEPGWVVIAEATQRPAAGLCVAVNLRERQPKNFAVSLRFGRIIGEAKAEPFCGAACLARAAGWQGSRIGLLA
jgi:class 3 adenylate cyclase